MLSSYQQHKAEFWTDMRALLEISLQNVYIQSRDVVSVEHLYTDITNPPPYALNNSCEFTEGKRAIHFSHAGCDGIKFCEQRSGLETWVNSWRELCITQTISQP